MKKYFITILLFISLIFSLAFKNRTINTFPLFGKLIFLDPGHGNFDPGSIYKDEYEKDYNLSFAKSLKNELESLGASVILTREGDYDLSDPNVRNHKRSDFDNRIKLINDSNCDMYISLHMNFLSDSSYYGSQAFYTSKNAQNKIIADAMQEKFNKYFKFDKDARKIDNSKYMYQRLKEKGILIEYGFMSSYRDRTNLKKESYREELSKLISEVLVKYFTKIS